MICLKCKSVLAFNSEKDKNITCKKCNYKYLVVNKIPIMLTDEYDFYNYKRKLDRFVKK